MSEFMKVEELIDKIKTIKTNFNFGNYELYLYNPETKSLETRKIKNTHKQSKQTHTHTHTHRHASTQQKHNNLENFPYPLPNHEILSSFVVTGKTTLELSLMETTNVTTPTPETPNKSCV